MMSDEIATDTDRIPKRPPALELEYETHFFKFSPKALIDTIYNTISDVFDERYDRLKTELIRKFKNEISERDVCTAVDNLRLEVDETMAEAFKKFEHFILKKVFHIHNYILLPEHQIYDDLNPPSELDERKLYDEIEEKEISIKSLRFQNELLKAELIEINFVQKYQENLMKTVNDFAVSLKRINDQKLEKEQLLNDFLNSLQNLQ